VAPKLQAALVEAKRLSGLARVSLIGLHLGATLAMRGALDAAGVDSLVLWAPYAKGRTFVARGSRLPGIERRRKPEFSARRRSRRSRAAGFLFTAATMDEISGLDLTAAAVSPAPATLVVGRDGNGSELPLVKHLQSLARGSRTAWRPATPT